VCRRDVSALGTHRSDCLVINRLFLAADAECVDDLASFYERSVGLAVAREGDDVIVRLSGGEVHFHPAAGAPWYHFAFLVPGNRFDAALRWAERHLPLEHGRDGPVVAFPNWDAKALYFKDPAGNPVELIAHAGYEETPTTGDFSPSELRGISEIMAITDDLEKTGVQLRSIVGLAQWDGSLEAGIAFLGRRARTVIVGRTGRHLLTGEIGEPHPLSIELSDQSGDCVRLHIDNTVAERSLDRG
jgi:hypothetical protein